MAQGFRSVVMGYNHNVRHAGRLFHIQSEDGGSQVATVTTHIFHDGAAIASRTFAYHDLLGQDELAGKVKKRMQEQHKVMMRELRGGEHDQDIARILEPSQPRPQAASGSASPPAPPPRQPRQPPRPANPTPPPVPREAGAARAPQRP